MGLHLPAGHGLLQGRQLEDHAEDGGHGLVMDVGLVIEDQVLELPALDGHQYHAMGRVDRRDDAPGPRAQAESTPGAGAHAHAAAQADGFVQPRFLALRVMGIPTGHEAHGLHWADLHALPAAVAGLCIHLR